MNICLVSYGFPDFVSSDTNGISTYYFWMAQGLAQRGHNVFVLSPHWHGAPGESVAENIRIWSLPIGNIHYYNSKLPVLKHGSFWMMHQEIGVSARSFIQSLAEKYGVDIVELYAPINTLWRLLPQKNQIPFVVTMHGLPFSFKRDLKEPLRLMDHVGLWCYQYAMQKAQRVICPSNFVAKEVHSMGIGANKVESIPYPITEDFVGYANRVQVQTCSPMVLSLSPVNFPKGLDTLTAAIPIVKKEIPNVCFVHIGKRENQKLSEKFLETGAGILCDPIPWPYVSAYHKASDLVISASRFETVGYTLLEGMIHKKPVVAPRVGGMTDLVVNGNTGFLVEQENPNELADAVIQILQDKSLAKKMGQQGYQHALNKFGMDKVISQKMELYQRLKRPPKRNLLGTIEQVSQ